MLRLVHPADHGQDPPIRKGRRSAALSLTVEETQHFRAALRNVARAYGGFPVLAGVVGVSVDGLRQALKKSRRGSAVLALRVAKAAGMTMEAIIGPTLTEAGRCAACGSRVADRRAS
jgi:DNA-binding phage protein